MNVAFIVVTGILLSIAFGGIAYAVLVDFRKDQDDERQERQEEQKRSDDLNDEFAKRLHELHSTRFGKPMVDPRTIKRTIVLSKDRRLTKRKKA